MPELRLVIFDVDGTLVDSQADILAAMAASYAAEGITLPDRAAVLSIVGLSLPVAMESLSPGLDPARRARMVETYKDAYVALREKARLHETSPLYPGARAALDRLQADPFTLLGVATGKSRRGLDKLIEGHGLEGLFVTTQVSDHHPSKPHPAMLLACLSETGVAADRAVMVGDTRFDMDMARAAGVRGIGVDWGYHAADTLTADAMIGDFSELDAAVDGLIGQATEQDA